MKTIIDIYKRDINRIVSNKILLIITVGLILIPALYAWISINANWDPYGNTKNLMVAVVNNDKGAQLKNTQVNFGDEIIEKLNKNQSIGWTFVNQKEAEKGIKYGKYYAIILIPEDFSADLLSIVTQNQPQKAKLIYYVNEKVNAITPKITKSGLTSLQNEIVSSFTQEVTNTVLRYIDIYGDEFQLFKSKMDDMLNKTGELEFILPNIGQGISAAYHLSDDIHRSVENMQKSIPVLESTLNQYANIAKISNDYLVSMNKELKEIPDIINTNLIGSKGKIDTVAESLEEIKNSVIAGNKVNKQKLQSVSNRVEGVSTILTNNINLLKSVNNVLNSSAVSNFIDTQQQIVNKLQNSLTNLNQLSYTLDQGKQITSNALEDIIETMINVSNTLDLSKNNFNNNISPIVNTFMENAMGISDNSLLLLQNAQNNLPIINSVLQDTKIATELGSTQLLAINDKFPMVQQELQNAINKIKNLNSDEKYNSMMELLHKDPQAISKFLSNPVELKQERIYPIPNYGSAMTPFYTALAIWVSAIVSLSLLSVKVEPLDNGGEIEVRKQFFGRYLTFATIAIVQAFVVSAGNLFLLKAYATNPMVFLFFSIYVGIVFNMIVYTLVSILGNVGKALALIIMVLQVSASGGTFPVQLTPRFFQNISPMLPFTYAIGGMREAQGGIIWSVLFKNAAMLSIFFILSIILAIFFKDKINQIMERFINKAKESGLVGE